MDKKKLHRLAINFMAIAIITFLLSGCEAMSSHIQFQETNHHYLERMLDVHSIDGAKRLKLESNFDPKLKEYVTSNGKPDYIYPISRFESFFVYLKSEKCVHLERSFWSHHSQITELQATPPEFRAMIPEWSNLPVITPPADAPSIVKRVQVSSGTGFAISKNQIATARHVIAESENIEVQFIDGDWIAAKLVKESKSTDIAILEIATERSHYLTPDSKEKTLTGDRIFTMGFPAVQILGTEAKYTDGVVSSLSGLGNDSGLLQITVPIQPGSSGGPLVREDGALVGMVTSTAGFEYFATITESLPQNINWGVKAEYIYLLLDNSSSKIKTDGRQKRDRRQILKDVNSSICRIRCY